MRQSLTHHPIGRIRTPFRSREGMPIQPSGAAGIRGRVEVDSALAAGLKDLDGFSHIILIYAFHQSSGYALEVTPFMDREPRGLFATRAPRRPNPIGLSIVRLVAVQGSILEIEGIDVLDETPLLDIKPYVPAFDAPSDVRVGWLENRKDDVRTKRSDARFA